MNLETTAMFIGHSECHKITCQQIKEEIIKLINLGVTDFLSGGQGEFDRLCGHCVYELKKEYPYINNHIVIPYLSFKVYNTEIFDTIIFPENLEKCYFKAAIDKRNKFMIENSGYAICYVEHSWGGAAKTYQQAIRKGVKVINLIK